MCCARRASTSILATVSAGTPPARLSLRGAVARMGCPTLCAGRSRQQSSRRAVPPPFLQADRRPRRGHSAAGRHLVRRDHRGASHRRAGTAMPRHTPRHMPRHAPRRILRHMPRHMPRHTPRHMLHRILRHMPRHMLRHTPRHMHTTCTPHACHMHATCTPHACARQWHVQSRRPRTTSPLSRTARPSTRTTCSAPRAARP